jgi:hypothetical protein
MADGLQKRLEGRNGEIWQHYIAGRNQEWIADKYSLAQSSVSDVIRKVRDGLPTESKDEWRQRLLDSALLVHAELLGIALSSPPPVFQAGEILTDADGEVVRDYSAKMSATSHMAKYQERMSRLLGLDAPVSVEQVGDLKVTIESVDLDKLT